MRLNRRTLIQGSVAATLWPGSTFAASDMATLEPRPTRVQLLPQGYPETDLWLFGETTPGPEIRVAKGGRVERRLINGLSQPTSVHWHGIRIDNAMDGVPDLTQAPIQPGDHFDYSFTAPDAGTYWYHSHLNSTEQVARGLYGPLIVEESAPPDVDRDIVLMLDDWRLEQNGAVSETFDSRHDRSHAGRLGNYPTTNGESELTVPVQRYERLRLRLINASNARIYELAVQGFDAWIVALDGMPLSAPQRLDGSLTLAPAQRADLIADVVADQGGEAFLVSIENGEGYAHVAFPVSSGAIMARRDAPSALPPNDVPQIDLASAMSATLVMEGGAMGGLTSATMNGQVRGMRELAEANQFWALNGAVGMQEAPLIDAQLGQTVRLVLRNQTAFPHGMHLHGQHFREVMPDDTFGAMRDTLLIQPREVREIAFVASNPGDWLLHCHMLAHQASGMKTWMRVSA